MKRPELRDPRGLILSADQPDFPTAVKFANALLYNGVTVHRATADFTARGKEYPSRAPWWCGRTRPFPAPSSWTPSSPGPPGTNIPYPGWSSHPPYDVGGVGTLAFQHGGGVSDPPDPDGFERPFEPVTGEELPIAHGHGLANAQGASGFLAWDRRVNNSGHRGEPASSVRGGRSGGWRPPRPLGGTTAPPGGLLRGGEPVAGRDAGAHGPGTGSGLPWHSTRPSGEARQLRPVRVGGSGISTAVPCPRVGSGTCWRTSSSTSAWSSRRRWMPETCGTATTS